MKSITNHISKEFNDIYFLPEIAGFRESIREITREISSPVKIAFNYLIQE